MAEPIKELLRELREARDAGRLTKEQAGELRGAEELARAGMGKEALPMLRKLAGEVRAGKVVKGAPTPGVTKAEKAAEKVPAEAEREAEKETEEAAEELAKGEKSAASQSWYQPLRRAAAEIQGKHPVLSGLILGILRGVWRLKKPYLMIASASMFAAFIFEEALQAFGFSLSMGVRGDRDKMADPELSTKTEYDAWVREQVQMIELFENCIGAADWWVTYPGATALWFIRPYAHYVAAARLQAASMRSLLQDIDDERKNLTGKGATKRASDAGFSVDRAFDAVQGYGFRIDALLKLRDEHGSPAPDIGGARGAVADMRAALKDAVGVLDAARPYMNRPQDKWAILSFEAARSGFGKAIVLFERQIDRMEKGATTEGEAASSALDEAAKALCIEPPKQ